MQRLTFYTNPMSRGRIARWGLEEVGQPYDTVVLDYGTTMKAPDYLALNPMGKVPTLVHGTRVVTECAAVLAYLGDAFPAAGLVPEDRSSYYRWLFFGAGPLEQAVTNRALGVTVQPDQERMVGYGTLDQTVAALEGWLKRHDYICGPAFTMADVYLGSQIGWGLKFGTLPALPAFAAYWSRLEERPALVRANAADDALMPKDPAWQTN